MEIGTTVSVQAVKATCGNDIVLLDESANNLLTVTVTGSDTTFNYTFDEAGTFTFFCGAGTTAIATHAICVDVQTIPTLSEWGIISLTLLLLIVGVNGLKHRKSLVTSNHL